MGVRWLEGDGRDVIVADDTFFPIIVATWFGAPSERAVRGYFAWLDEILPRAVKAQVPIMNVTDSSAAEMPNAEVRRLIAELTRRWELAGASASRVTSFVVVDSAVIRGVLRALAWLHGSINSRQCATMKEALTDAVAILATRDVPPPAGLVPAEWRRPAQRRS